MTRWSTLFLLLSLLMYACGGSDGGTSSQPDASVADAESDTASAQDTSTTDTNTSTDTRVMDSSESDTSDADTPPLNAAELPYLPPGQHPSMIVGFEAYPETTATQIDAIQQEALRSGMKVGRVQLDWAGLETGPRQYNKDALREALATMKEDGLKPFVSISAIDSEGLVIPEDLVDESTSTKIVNNRPLNDPDIVARYNAMLDWAVPMIVEEGGWVLSIANEPEGYLEDNTNVAPAVVDFFASTIAHAHTLDTGLAVTVTMTSALLVEKPQFHDSIVELLDVVTYNYYPLKISEENFGLVLRAPLNEVVPNDFDKLVDAAMGKQILFQELGCPAGYDDGLIGSSPEAQAEFFQIAFAKMAAIPEIRAVFVFQLVDWSETLTDIYEELLSPDAGVPEAFYLSFRESLETVGLITYADGSARPALDLFLEAVEDFQ